MKNKLFIIIGILFLITIMNNVIGAGYDWTMYGQGYQPLTQTQLIEASSTFDISNITTKNINFGQDQYTHPTQPLVDELSITDTNYLVIQDGNFIKIYTKNYDFQTEVYLNDSAIGQLGIVDWNQDGTSGEITGFFRENNTQIHFKAYEYNQTTNLINNIYDLGFTYPETNGITGIRCSGYECYGVIYDTNGTGYLWQDIRINKTGYESHLLYSTRTENQYYPLEPPAKTDYDNNGINDYLVFAENKVVIYDQTGNIIRNWTFSKGSNRDEYVRGAKFFKPDASPYWKVAVVYDVPYQASSSLECGTYACGRIQILNIVDGSIIYENNFIATTTSGDNPRTQGIAIGDYNLDGYDEAWAVGSKLNTNRQATLYIYQGDGTTSYTTGSLGTDIGATYPNSQITLARMDDDAYYELIIYDGTIKIWSPNKNTYIYNNTLPTITGQGTCIPTDINYDGQLEIICADEDSTEILTTNYTNQNPTITLVAYDPSTLVQEGTTINTFVTANDPEGDGILYSGECNTGEGYSTEKTNNVISCTYNTAGTYNQTIRIRDSYHTGIWDSFSQTIIVTSTGTLCNNNELCEAEQGETQYTCPNDCGNPSIQQSEGGTPIPTKLVNLENTDEGLLPEIYFGTLAFFSNTITPIIIIIFVIFFTLIILTIGGIIKKIGKKAGSG